MEGIDLAKKRGAYKGRKRSLNLEEIKELKARIDAGEKKSDIYRSQSKILFWKT